MISSVGMKRFKKFVNEEITVSSDGITLLAGPNNSGKSTLLHALAVWSFCVFVLRRGKGDEAVLIGYTGQGYGVSDDDFNPINLPDLKHLWSNLKAQIPGEEGYSLSIGISWSRPQLGSHSLKISLSLTNDRLFIRCDETDLSDPSALPEIVYLPPVAGLVAKEPFASPAVRRSMLGRGLAGSVLRNVLLRLREENDRKRQKLKVGRPQISKADLKKLRAEDPWELLQATLRKTFGFELIVPDYDDTYHTILQAFTQRVEFDDALKRYRNVGVKRDLMVEGAGALQWICVYAYAADPGTDILLLDEPDAHLHSSLQGVLLEALEDLIKANGKQVLIATHSREVLLNAPLSHVISFGGSRPKYLRSESDRVRMFAGLGEEYDPFIDRLRKTKKILFTENDSDYRALSSVASALGLKFPSLAQFSSTDPHKDRRKFFMNLEKGVYGISALSLRDRDEVDLGTISPDTLRDKSDSHKLKSFFSRTLRRRNIESYALVPTCLARTLDVPVSSLKEWWEKELYLPWAESPPVDAPNVLSGDFKDAIQRRVRASGKGMDDFWSEIRVRTHNQNMTVAAMQMAERNSSPHLS
jgi:DNA polymerase III delta prime subunit